MLEIAYGEPKDSTRTRSLIQTLESAETDGSLYIGYPILGNVEDKLFIDALLISSSHGLIVFDLSSSYSPQTSDADFEVIKDKQDKIFGLLQSKLYAVPELREGRKLAVDAQIVSLIPNLAEQVFRDDLIALSFDGYLANANKFHSVDDRYIRSLNAAVQRIATLRPKNKRTKVVRTDSKGAILKVLDKEIANLDQWQKSAAIEYSEGPQRIRGLAGSGKTVVLALKAAYMHARHPEWQIAVTFSSRSLYQQFTDLISRFVYEQMEEKPDWNNLHILHAWGSADMKGMYSSACNRNGIEYRNFRYASEKYGRHPFNGILEEYLEALPSTKGEALFDAVLIDEAQDLPIPFFHLVYHLTKSPKRIIWAYDDLQNLGDYYLPSPEDLFPRNGVSIYLENIEGEPKQDIILPVCYRNTHWALTVAHALGFGVYRDKGLVQMFEDSELWKGIGYRVAGGELQLGSNVKLMRRENSYPGYFSELLTPEDALICMSFDTDEMQYAYVVEEIRKNLTADELEPSDILIVLPDAYTSRSKGGRLMRLLQEQGITSHLAGVTSTADTFRETDSVTITHIHRAKGNEAPVVYVLNSEYCYSGLSLATKRNILFTAITRSRGWVRILGVGADMISLKAEVDAVIANDYALEFVYPTREKIETMRKSHRDVNRRQHKQLEQSYKMFDDLIESVRRGEIPLEGLSPEFQEVIAKKLQE